MLGAICGYARSMDLAVRYAIYGSLVRAGIHGLRKYLWIVPGTIYRSIGSLYRPYLNLTYMN